MALGSALLKRAYISKCTGLPWNDIVLARKDGEKMGKPCWNAPDDSENWPFVEFNVSHQRGIVTLVGVCCSDRKAEGESIEVAVDVVSPTERPDALATRNFGGFVNVYEYMLSEQEVYDLTFTLPPGGHVKLLNGEGVPNEMLGRLDRLTSGGSTHSIKLDDGRTVEIPAELILEEKLRNFYATFSLKEAFTKLGGLGITAPWLKELEFGRVRAPAKGGVRRCSILGTWGEVISGTNIDVSLFGKAVEDVVCEQQSLEEDHIITTMIKPRSILDGAGIPSWTTLCLQDIVP